MLASNIIERARSLADLQNSRAISWADEKNSINESYKLVYNKLSESDDDYFLNDFLYQNIGIYKDTIPYSYSLPLPADFYKLRTVSYNLNGSWQPMSRLPLNMRNSNTSEPYYRMKNDDLWIVAGTTTQVSEVLITYYPPAELITLPDYSTSFNIKVPLADKVSLHHCISDENTVFESVGNNIFVYTQNRATPTLLFTSLIGAVTYPIYYKGLLYFYEGTTLSYIDTNAVGLAIPIQTTLSVLPFTVQNDIIYYTNGTDTFSNYFLGGSQATLFAGAIRYCVRSLGGASYAFIEGNDYYVDAALIDTGVSYLSYPFYNKNDDTLSAPTVIWKANTNIGALWNNRVISNSTLDRLINTYSTILDTDLLYPTNALFEILAYQSASDFKRKYEEASADLDGKLGQMWDAFLFSIIRRDEYKTEKVQNVYNIGSYHGNY